MAVKKPLVLTAGRIEQLQAGDTIEAVAAATGTPVTNKQGTSIVIGQPVYAVGPSQVGLAQADDHNTAHAIGLVLDTSIANNAVGNIVTGGTLVATTTQWDAVVEGGSGGLVFGTKYFLSTTTAGKLTPTPPASSSIGFSVAPIGTGISTTELRIQLEPEVEL
jgi:hypothetical protein